MRGALLALVWALAACGSDGETSPSVSDVPDVVADVATDTTPDVVDLPCPTGHVLGADGECMAVGIQDCDAMFINPETGLCEPSPDHCPPGQIPIFSGETQGCRVVGIPDCDAMFINPETGLCDPTPDHCPPGQIPVFSGEDQGCHPVGIVDCAPEFVNAETGLCDPDPDFCDEGFLPVPTQGCVSLDPPGGCGEGTWGNVEELPGDVHVDVAYTGGDSDGSREKPWTLIAYALGNTLPGGRMVLAAGDYDEGVLLAKSISLVGRCASMVTVSGTRTGPVGPTVVEAKGDVDVVITDIKISGVGIGVTAHSGVNLQLKRVRLEDNQNVGLLGSDSGTSIEVLETLIARTNLMSSGTGGRGIGIQVGASLSLRRSNLVDNHELGIYASDLGTSAAIDESLIARTKPLPAGNGGRGVFVRNGAAITLERTTVVENHEVGLFIMDPGTSAEVHEALVARTQPSPDGTGGRGIGVQDGANLSMERSGVVANHRLGVFASDSGTTVEMRHTLIARTNPGPDGFGGGGFNILGGASLLLEGASVVANHDAGILAFDSGTTVVIQRSLLAGTKLSANETMNHGIGIQYGVTLDLTRSSVVDNPGVGLFVGGADATAEVHEALIARTRPLSDGDFGMGVVIAKSATLHLTRSCARENHGTGLWIDGEGTQADVSETLFTQMKPLAAEGYGGRGVDVSEAATLRVERSSSVANHEAAIFYRNSSGTVSDCMLAHTETSALNPLGIADGLLVSGGVVDTHGIVARGNARAGILYDKSQGDITSCVIRDNAIGLADQGLPGATVTDDNVIEDNERNLHMESHLDIPDKAIELPDPPALD